MEMYGVDAEDREDSIKRAAARIHSWNTALAMAARRFASPKPAPLTPRYVPNLSIDPDARPPIATAEAQEREGASIMFFSSHECFSTILDSPATYALSEGDLNKTDGSIWVDHLHPTSRVHDFVARDLSRFLGKIM
jgi:hypothetical protein